MNENNRRAIVWDVIERIAFRPNPSASWLSVYAKTLHKLWGVEPIWSRFATDDHFTVPFLTMNCNYRIESAAKYSASLVQDSSKARCHWCNHIDPAYLSKASLHSASSVPARYPRTQRAYLRGDIEAVLDGMIFHPRCHTHLEDLGIRQVELDHDKGGLSSHEVRIGGGIENSYVFLFHLRYQFCLVSNEFRNAERHRLINLFEESVGNNQHVNARDLFNFQH